MSDTILLSIDTCTRLASVALAREEQVWIEHTWVAGRDHTAQLAPRIQSLFSEATLAPTSLGAVVVATGPGSFNGVRAGMATAKAMAFALDLPLVGVSGLEAQAYVYAPTGLPICPIQDAGRGELAVALYRTVEGGWLQVRPEAIVSWEELEGLIQEPTIICGDLYPSLAAEARRRLTERAILTTPAAGPRRAGYLAELGWIQIKEGKAQHPGLVQPLYLRRPAITERRKA